MVAWLVVGTGIGWLLASWHRGVYRSETVMAVAVGVVGALLEGLATGVEVDGALDLGWQPSGLLVGATLGALLMLLWLRLDTR